MVKPVFDSEEGFRAMTFYDEEFKNIMAKILAEVLQKNEKDIGMVITNILKSEFEYEEVDK